MIAEHSDALTRNIHQLLRQLCIGGNLRGFYYLAYAIELTVRDPLCVQFITKGLYPAVARRYGTSLGGVERAIRTAINACWSRGGRENLNRIIHRNMIERPSAAEFIDIAADYIRSNT